MHYSVRSRFNSTRSLCIDGTVLLVRADHGRAQAVLGVPSGARDDAINALLLSGWTHDPKRPSTPFD